MAKRRGVTDDQERERARTIYRKINPRVHGSEDFLALSSAPSGRALWLFLLSCRELTRIPGVILAGPLALAESIEWAPADFDRCLGEVLDRGMAKMDRRARVLWLTHAHFQDENRPENPNQVIGWRTTWDLIPECALKAEIWSALDAWMRSGEFAESIVSAFEEACPKPRNHCSGNPSANGSRDGYRNQESGVRSQESGVRSQDSGTRREDRARSHEATPSSGTDAADRSPSPAESPSRQERPGVPLDAAPLPTPAPTTVDAAQAQPGRESATRARPSESVPLVEAEPVEVAEAKPATHTPLLALAPGSGPKPIAPEVLPPEDPSPDASGDSPLDDVLDYLSEFGAREAIAIYNEHRHPSLPAWDTAKLGIPAGLLLTMATDATRERSTGAAPPWPMHRRSGWVAFTEKTHEALWLHEPGQRYDLAWWFRGARRGAVECEGYEKRQALFAGRYQRGRTLAPTSGRSLAENAKRVLEAERRARGQGTNRS